MATSGARPAVLIGLVAVFSLAPRSVAAESTGTVTGTVTDESGGVLPGAFVTATRPDPGSTCSGPTTRAGRFRLACRPGSYVIRAELAGFAPFVSKAIVLEAGGTHELAIVLAIQPYGETVVVTGNRSEEALRSSPVAMTVVDERQIESTPATNYADLLRGVPGLNAIELSARDIQISTRTASGRNARTTLALLDGRSVYQDYFGMVLWDLLPVSFDEIKRVEVLRGPGSALWGANALTGVVNIITKSPAEAPGTKLRLGIGERSTKSVGVSHAEGGGRLSYRLSGSYYSQDQWPRPTTLADGTPLAPYRNQGTTQYKADARLDFEQSARERWRFDAGFASSGGLILISTGPFEADPLRQGYASAEYARGSASFGAYFTAHEARYVGLLAPSVSDIKSQSLTLDAKDSRTLGQKQLLVYGGSFKYGHFDLNFVPDQHRRQELGAFLTDDIFVTDRLRLSLGARLDWFDTFGAFVSPRAGIRFDPLEGHTLRASYNRAYVAPSLVENFSQFPTSSPIPLPTGPFSLPILIAGDPDLEPQTINAFEVGYTANIGGRATASASLYRQKTDGPINIQVAELYTPADPPPGWPLPPSVLAQLPLPKTFRFMGIGTVEESGLELSLDVTAAPGVVASASYSWQARPDVSGSTPTGPVTVNIPPRHLLDFGLTLSRGRLLATASVRYTDRAVWTDVLAIRAETGDFWLLNATLGLRFADGRASWLVKGTNLADTAAQHHAFGDIIRRRLMTELRFRF